MKCPACRSTMIILDYEGIELDYCPACAGVWLDEGELELLLGGEALARAFMGTAAKAPDGEGRRRCPRCRRHMDKAAAETKPPLTYDRCPRGDGLWFDKGELLAVLERGAELPGGPEVSQWLRACFGEGASRAE